MYFYQTILQFCLYLNLGAQGYFGTKKMFSPNKGNPLNCNIDNSLLQQQCGGSEERRGLDHGEACISQFEGRVISEDTASSRIEAEIGQLISYEGLGREERTIVGAKDLGGSFLKDMPPTSTLNAIRQPHQLH